MKLGVFAVLFAQKSLEETLDYIAAKGLDAIEIGTGGYPGNSHCNPEELLADAGKLKAFKKAVESRGLIISALSCHGNPLHPQQPIAQDHHNAFIKTIELAEKLEVSATMRVPSTRTGQLPLGLTIIKKFLTGNGRIKSFLIGRKQVNLLQTAT
jgi:sugar phosphate isomerase/epimerase